MENKLITLIKQFKQLSPDLDAGQDRYLAINLILGKCISVEFLDTVNKGKQFKWSLMFTVAKHL